YQLQNNSKAKVSLDQIQMAVSAGMMTKDQLISQMNEAFSKMGDLTDTYLTEIAVNYVSAEYQAQGIDLNHVRNAYLFTVGGKMLLMAIVMAIAAILVGLIASITSSKVGRDLRASIYEKVMHFTDAEMEKFSTASLITRSTNDIQQIQMVSVMLLRMVLYAPIVAIGGIIMVIKTGSSMGWTIVLAVVVMMACVGTLTGIAMPKFKIMQKLVDRLNLVSREMLTGIMPIRAFSREKHEEQRFDEANQNLYKTQLFTNRTMTFMMPVMMFVMNGISVLIVWVGGHGVDAGTMQVGDLTAFITYSMVIVMGFLMLTMISIMLPRAGVAADRIVEVLDMPISLSDPERPKDAALEQPKGYVTFQDVSFTYPDADESALSHISFTAEPGKTTAIIGSTGCGKSTIVRLIPRFFDVTEGSIKIDGVDVREMTQHKLRSLMGYVPQKGTLFSGTIESNLKYGGEDISDEAMHQAADIAQATEFIDSKVDRYDSLIAQGGTNVSGGQKQRLSIARAIAKHPKIFLFDDSFSALDYKTDLTLRKELAKQTADATVIIVAQRISTILHADNILVLDEGKIVGSGTHEELLASCETYQEIAKSQLSEAELAGVEKGGRA
ncbi:ABC transporter ATP-binding protein, partial [Butyricicoccus sp.]|uniref:ABC transporter ATP-binding protein n=1 Tax=Butyricicoccus sp. TaxID=2049021 RepID=UPI003D7CC4A2